MQTYKLRNGQELVGYINPATITLIYVRCYTTDILDIDTEKALYKLLLRLNLMFKMGKSTTAQDVLAIIPADYNVVAVNFARTLVGGTFKPAITADKYEVFSVTNPDSFSTQSIYSQGFTIA